MIIYKEQQDEDQNSEIVVKIFVEFQNFEQVQIQFFKELRTYDVISNYTAFKKPHSDSHCSYVFFPRKNDAKIFFRNVCNCDNLQINATETKMELDRIDD